MGRRARRSWMGTDADVGSRRKKMFGCFKNNNMPTHIRAHTPRRIGSRRSVMTGHAQKTGGGLTKSDLKFNRWGRIVSKKVQAQAFDRWSDVRSVFRENRAAPFTPKRVKSESPSSTSRKRKRKHSLSPSRATPKRAKPSSASRKRKRSLSPSPATPRRYNLRPRR